jgi:sugar lactone lactonase YvrE
MLTLFALFCVVSLAASAPQHEYAFEMAWGGYGNQPGQFNMPAGVAVGGDGAIYVADSNNHRVQKLAIDGALLAVWGGLGSAPGKFNHPWGIAANGDRDYVADRDNKRIQVFDTNGGVIAVWDMPGSTPTGVAQRGALVYVTDTANQRVLVYSTDGQLLRQWGGYGALVGQFFAPWGIVALPDESVFVVDRGNHRLQRFTSGGQFLASLGSFGQRCGDFDTPAFVALLPNGNLMVSDQATNRISELTPQGECVTWWGHKAPGQVQSPVGVASDPTGRVYVADAGNHRIMVYSYNELAMSYRVFLPVIFKATQPLLEVRVNCGDGSYLDAQGKIWLADQEYRVGGWGYLERASSVYTTETTIEGTLDQRLYQSERYSMAGYAFDVPVGYYEVTLKFAEIFRDYDRAGQRIFSVSIEGNQVITDLDLVAQVGQFRPYDRTFAVPVTDGQLTIEFSPKRFNDAPKINAILVRQLSESPNVTPTPTPPTELTVSFVQGVDGYSGARDTFIDIYSPTHNMDGLPYLAIRPYREDQGRASLLRFDVSSIPANATVLDARLALHVSDRTNVNGLYVGLYRLLRPWSVSEATWISATQSSVWAIPGALGASDHQADAEDALAIDTVNAWYTFTVPSLVQTWVRQPQQNNGVILQGATGGAVEYKASSSESFREDFRPRLTVLYTTAPQPATPTPTITSTPTASPVPSVTPTATPTRTPLATATATPTPSATVVVLQQGLNGYAGAQDTMLYAWNPDTNYGSEASLYVRSNDFQSPLLRFELLGIPADAIIDDATLSMYVYASSNPNLLVADVFPVLRPWVVTEATWVSATQTIAWDAPGCNGVGVDRGPFVVDVQGLDSVGHWYTFDIRELISEWLRTPQSNYGLIIKGREGAQVQYSFRSSDSPIQAQRPSLMWSETPAILR